jgi:hypothetical protein
LILLVDGCCDDNFSIGNKGMSLYYSSSYLASGTVHGPIIQDWNFGTIVANWLVDLIIIVVVVVGKDISPCINDRT